MDEPAIRAIGLMSGTSLDGVDAAWIESDGVTISRTGPAATLHYEPALRADLRRLLDRAPALRAGDGGATPDAALDDIERRLTLDHALAIGLLGLGAELIGFHGQTILHQPERHLTWQIGDAALLAARCGVPVVHDFRAADVAVGGQGAPLAPLFHAALAHDLPKPLLVVNIGGVANITYLGADSAVLACDTGPGNALLDDFIQRRTGAAFDHDGALAAGGGVHRALLARWLAQPFFARPAPKSLDRLAFAALAEDVAGLSDADGAATLAAFTVAAIARAPLPAAPLRVLVCGGGRHNAAIMRGLAAAFAVPVQPVEAVGWDGDALEAQCFGFLAVRSRRGLPLSLPTTTGVPAPTPGGRLQEPG